MPELGGVRPSGYMDAITGQMLVSKAPARMRMARRIAPILPVTCNVHCR
ncbi:MAG: hypothetical protein F9K15_10665 [Zoogloea sp.]|nr:MAG: hypothetical protein F9K15_10665 [Zoogloea sp.]